MKLLFRLTVVLALTAALSWAARFPIIGGPGLVHLQSAKTGSMFGYRTVNSFSSYGQQRVSYLAGAENSYNDIWSYQLLSFAPLPNMSLLLSGVAHGEQWTITSPGGEGLDNTLGCPGDITISGKYSLALADQMVDLGIMPIISVPVDKDKYDDGPSQTGQLDFGAKILGDINLRQSTLYANLGFLTRGDQRPQVPAGAGSFPPLPRSRPNCGWARPRIPCRIPWCFRAGAMTAPRPGSPPASIMSRWTSWAYPCRPTSA